MKKKKCYRQGLVVSIRELEDLIKELKKEQMELNRKLHLARRINKDAVCQVSIINQNGCADGWTLER